jgi:hypothetical protein
MVSPHVLDAPLRLDCLRGWPPSIVLRTLVPAALAPAPIFLYPDLRWGGEPLLEGLSGEQAGSPSHNNGTTPNADFMSHMLSSGSHKSSMSSCNHSELVSNPTMNSSPHPPLLSTSWNMTTCTFSFQCRTGK